MKFTISDMGMGMIQAVNDEIALIGGMRSGNSSANTTRLRYVIYDVVKYAEMTDKGESQADIDNECQVGKVDLFIKDGTKFDVTGLVNIEVTKKKEGYAKKVINGIVSTIDNELKIHDIKKKAVKIWEKLGVTSFTNGSGKEVDISKHKGFTEGFIPSRKEPEDDNSFSM